MYKILNIIDITYFLGFFTTTFFFFFAVFCYLDVDLELTYGGYSRTFFY